jgi:hypothetical protein
MVDIYQPRYRQTVTLQAPRRPASMASAVGAGMRQMGEAVSHVAKVQQQVNREKEASQDRIDQELNARARSAEVATASGRMAEMRMALRQQLETLPERQKPGAIGYAEAVRKATDEAFGGFLSTLSDDPEVRQRFEPMVANARAELLGDAGTWERGQFARFQGESVEKWRNERANALAAKPDANSWRQSIEDQDALLEGMDLDGNAREALRSDGRQRLTMAMLDGRLRSGEWGAVREALNSGALDSYLEPRAKQAYLDQADNSERAVQREAAAAQADAQDVAREALKAIRVRIDGGEEVPVSEITAAVEQGRGLGLPQSELLEAGFMARDTALDRTLRGMNTRQLEREVQGLRAKREAGALGADEARLLERAEKAVNDRDSATGERLGPLLKSGEEGRVQAVAQLAAMPIDQRWRTAEAAGDRQAAVIADLAPRGQALAVKGGALRKARPDDFLPPKRGTIEPRKQAEAAFRAKLGNLVSDSGSAFPELMETALDVMAATGDAWDAGNFDRAIEVVYGASRRGDGRMQGGIGLVEGRKVELPKRWTAEEFAVRFARNPFPGALLGNGSAANPADIRRHFRLRHAGPGEAGGENYLLIGPDNKPLLQRDAKGQVGSYVLKLSEVPQ